MCKQENAIPLSNENMTLVFVLLLLHINSSIIQCLTSVNGCFREQLKTAPQVNYTLYNNKEIKQKKPPVVFLNLQTKQLCQYITFKR